MREGRACEQNSQELLSGQFGAAAAPVPAQAGGGWEEQGESTSFHATASHHWLFTAAWAATATAGEAECSDRDDPSAAWTISTASMPQEAFNSCEHAAEGIDGSDPLVSKAQELVAAAAACTTPGVHAPLSDSAALLNSGAVLLLGQGSTTMYGTNTAASVEASPGSTILSPDECRSHVLSSPQHTSTLQQASPAAQRPQQQQQQQQRSPAACRRAASRASRRRANRRRRGLLVDSQAGMQQLVAAVQASQHSQQDKPEVHAERSMQPQAQQQQSAVLSGLQGLSVKQSEDDSQSVPASGDVLVLGVSCTSSRADATPAAADAAQDDVRPAADEAADAAGDGAGRSGGHAATAAQPVLQLLSCSSLNSNPPAGRSNSSLFHLNLSNCSFLRLGSFTGTHSFAGTHTSSFSSNNDSFTAQSRPGSFTGQHTGTAAAGGALQSPSPAVGPASRPSPLPMLHESCSWGKNLDAADRRAGQQQAAPVRRQQGATPADGQHQQLLRQQQLIYLLD